MSRVHPSHRDKRRKTFAVRLYESTANSKLAPVALQPYKSATYNGKGRPIPRMPFVTATRASIAGTCRSSCMFKEKGCYERAGFTSRVSTELDRIASDGGLSPVSIAVQEETLIRGAFGGKRIPKNGKWGPRPLRLHVGGDVYDSASASVLARAALDWLLRGGGPVWTYTHSWKHIPRRVFGAISVLASVEWPTHARAALAAGYAPAVVVDRFPSDKRFTWHGIELIPCPAETRGITCVECRLCFDDSKLVERKMGIAFAKHGRDAKHIHLPVLG